MDLSAKDVFITDDTVRINGRSNFMTFTYLKHYRKLKSGNKWNTESERLLKIPFAGDSVLPYLQHNLQHSRWDYNNSSVQSDQLLPV